jgi:tetratricopeptide (TPR) repeat protein
VSRTADDEQSEADGGWRQARDGLFRMIMEGRSFSGRERNCFFLNTGQGLFGTISALSGIDFPDDGRCIAVTDWDRDGDQDLWISNRSAPRLRFLRNDTPSRHHFLALKLEGDGTSVNRDAIGARVEVVLADDGSTAPAAGRRLVQTLRAGEGFLSQSSKWLHFGLGAATAIDHITVHWPGGSTQTYPGVPVDGRYVAAAGPAAELVAAAGPAAEHTAEPGGLGLRRHSESAYYFAAAEPVAATRVARVALMSRVPMPALTYQLPGGSSVRVTFPSTPASATLINLWASWCHPCLEELSAFVANKQQLDGAGLNVIALSVDGLSPPSAAGDDETPSAASVADLGQLLQRIGYTQAWGQIDAQQMTLLQELHDQFFFLKRPLPLPSSLLVDAEGRLAVIYRGPVSVEQLLADVRLTVGDYAEMSRQAACFPGRVIDHPRVEAVARRADLQTRYRVAAWLEETARYADALRGFRELVEIDPTWALAQRHVGKLLLSQNQLAEAKLYATRAVELDPSSAGAHNTLGLVYSAQGDQSAAEAQLRRAIELDPKFAEAQNNLGTVLASQNKLDAAGECFQRAVEIDIWFVEAHINLGSVFAARGNIAEAIQHYEQAIALDPNSVDAHNNLGTMYARLRRYEQAIREYQLVLRLEPDHRGARRNLQLAEKMLGGRK